VSSLLACQISDLHVKAPGRLSYRVVDCAAMLARCVAEILRLPQRPDLVVATGDLTDSGRAEEYAHLRELLAPLPMPVYLIPGNHDERGALRAAFPEHDKRLAWLERILSLKRGKPTLLIMHHPPFPTLIGHMDQIGLAGSDALARVIERHPQVERVLCGHLHRPIQFRFAGTIASTCPSPAHQVALDLAPDAASAFRMEPPAFQLHAWRQGVGVVSHTAYIGDFAGPYPFLEESCPLPD
jgi:3',5'-cyclic AMP phosphodiesterase CpdA